MSLISFTPIQDGVTGVNAAATNNPLNTIFNDYNGNITDANIAVSAGIAGSKINYASIANPCKFSVYRSGAYGPSTIAAVPFDTVGFDTGTNYSTSTSRFTASVGGFYEFSTSLSLSTGSGNHYYAMIYKNGSELLRLSESNASGTTSTIYGGTTPPVQLSASDYIQVFLSVPGGTTVNTGSSFTWFGGFLISAT